MPLDRDEVKPRQRWPSSRHFCQVAEEVRAEAEAGFQYDELLAAAPPLRQPGPLDETCWAWPRAPARLA